jgi:hypothetical protein
MLCKVFLYLRKKQTEAIRLLPGDRQPVRPAPGDLLDHAFLLLMKVAVR